MAPVWPGSERNLEKSKKSPSTPLLQTWHVGHLSDRVTQRGQPFIIPKKGINHLSCFGEGDVLCDIQEVSIKNVCRQGRRAAARSEEWL